MQPDDHNIHMLGEVPYNCYPRPHFVDKFQGFGVYPRWDKKYIPAIEQYGLTSYQAEVRFTDQRGVIEVLFPAEAQLFTGDYDIVVVAKIYQSGYKLDNTKTITVDFSNYFTLTPGDGEISSQWQFGEESPIILS